MYIPSAKLTDKSLATILNAIYKVQHYIEMPVMDGEFININSCQKVISTISGLADAL